MKYDDASWHYNGNFPSDLPHTAGATHIGMFLAWMLLNELASEELLDDAESELNALEKRELTGGAFVISMLDEKLTDQEFNDVGNAFAIAYYEGLNNDSRYVDDYVLAFGVTQDAVYSVEDTWANYDKLSPLIDARFAEWQAMGKPEYIV
ncbi:hypothetical protein JOE33_000494 [Pseudomonas sp. PvP027]|uniref:DUF7832 domain-containing protein n=1 Tax=Pseudomonas TaxID=286 RepID=UPI00165552C7|nr:MULTISPECIES: hypothetical protein [Pseudomonas]MBC8802728.1 hypothetical protein [Pseudomonas congelans]MBP1143571.1 hypothetical protein [Pseudomonas sp. PvP027]